MGEGWGWGQKGKRRTAAESKSGTDIAASASAAEEIDDPSIRLAKASLEASLAAGEEGGPNSADAVVDLRGFSVEFGCFFDEVCSRECGEARRECVSVRIACSSSFGL